MESYCPSWEEPRVPYPIDEVAAEKIHSPYGFGDQRTEIWYLDPVGATLEGPRCGLRDWPELPLVSDSWPGISLETPRISILDMEVLGLAFTPKVGTQMAKYLQTVPKRMHIADFFCYQDNGPVPQNRARVQN